jgi:hypothetical protein
MKFLSEATRERAWTWVGVMLYLASAALVIWLGVAALNALTAPRTQGAAQVRQ